MLGRMPGSCLVEDCSSIAEEDASLVEEDVSMLTDFNGEPENVADLASGYAECMEEAMRYLIEEENYPPHHPAVEALRRHLDSYRTQLLRTAIYRTSGIGQSAF
uniref:Uncharacterized protein n=1 Tax=Lygus hesperus TaxID=30085 RepID=A0A0K8S7W4_LYGHE